MISLVLKDLEAAKLLLLLVLPLGVVHLAVFSSTGPIYLPAAMVFSGLLALGSIVVEETNRTELLWSSLPVSRGEIVGARYATSLLGIVAGLALGWGTGRAAAGLLAAGDGGPAPFTGLRAHVLLFAILALWVALYLPFYFHLGAGRGTLLFAATAVGLLLILTLGGQVVLLARGYSSPLLDPETWRETAPKLQEQLAAWLRPRIDRLLALGAGLSLFALAFSWLVSRRLYENRDL